MISVRWLLRQSAAFGDYQLRTQKAVHVTQPSRGKIKEKDIKIIEHVSKCIIDNMRVTSKKNISIGSFFVKKTSFFAGRLVHR